VLDCGNSGTTLRLLLGALAGQTGFFALTGDASLRRRPMGRVVRPLRQMGAQIDGAGEGSRAPLSLRGAALQAGDLSVTVASAQVKSALLLAALRAEGTLRLQAPASRDHSERLLRAMGVTLDEHDGALVMAGGQALQAVDVDVPADISAAAFFLVAGAITPGSALWLPGVGVNPSRTGVIDVLRRMGATITLEAARDLAGEPVADLRVGAGGLVGTIIEGAEIPRLIDELPVLAIAAAMAEGETVVRDAAELRVKESDRIATTVALVRALGVEAEALPDGFVIAGGGLRRGCEIDADGDHRLAMAAAVASCVAPGPVQIVGAEAAAVSFPEFYTVLAALGAG
jgi:3-phosphoshikimate 1-carboxyvinyltransferase